MQYIRQVLGIPGNYKYSKGGRAPMYASIAKDSQRSQAYSESKRYVFLVLLRTIKKAIKKKISKNIEEELINKVNPRTDKKNKGYKRKQIQ